MEKIIVMVAVGVVMAACSPNGIPLMGLDDEQNYFEYMVKEKKYESTIASLMKTTHESIAPALASAESQSDWHLRTVVFGLGFKIEAGLGPIITGSISPRFRLAFSNSISPVIP